MFITMTFPLSTVLLVLFGLSLILITLSLRLMRGTSLGAEPTSSSARFFLVVLRLAIGWHCFFEGVEKINAPNWSSEPYLRESMGPLAPAFHRIAGDRLIDKLTVGENDAFPPALDRAWQDYAQAFSTYYDLTDDQKKRVEGIVAQREKDTLTYLISKREEVTILSAYPPVLKVEWTMKKRLAEHERLAVKVHDLEVQFPTFDKTLLAKWKSAKDDLGKWRAELKKSVDAETAKMKEALKEDVLTPDQKKMDPMPDPRAPVESWQALEWSDFSVKWGLLVLGGCLMLGFCSRPASFLTALLILSFYAAMPPLPGWPESPRLEGHYVFINKSLIEVIALFALACMPTGRWAGIDGLLQFIIPKKRQAVSSPPSAAPAEAMSAPVPVGAK
jgi:uncharacterized membrane protein YphA (DoxX/SURF4 family)